MAQTDLKTLRYFQGSRTVSEYVNDFHEMITQARYMEGSHIVLKFWQGLNLKIQDYVACLTSGRPSDERPCEWYVAAILCDENCITNEAFKTSSRIATCPETSLLTSTMFHRPPVKVVNASPSLSQYTPQVATASNPSQIVLESLVRSRFFTSIGCNQDRTGAFISNVCQNRNWNWVKLVQYGPDQF
jgi:hypothetical protein